MYIRCYEMSPRTCITMLFFFLFPREIHSGVDKGCRPKDLSVRSLESVRPVRPIAWPFSRVGGKGGVRLDVRVSSAYSSAALALVRG